MAYDPAKPVISIQDISAMVSTNHVYKILFESAPFVVAKVSYFGKYEHFREDHTIINVLANSLKSPYHRVLARSLLKDGEVFTYRHPEEERDIWVVFYNPIPVKGSLPRRLEERHIVRWGQEMARFHKACADQVNLLCRVRRKRCDGTFGI